MWNRQSQAFLLAFKTIIHTVLWYPAARNQKPQALIAHYPDGMCQICSWNRGSAELEQDYDTPSAAAQVTLDSKYS